jgi:uncharacterized protein YjiS (DUF1127 family)
MTYTVGQAVLPRPLGADHSWLAVLDIWYQRYTQRRDLRQLDDHLLADIGISRAAAEVESRKPFWVA